MHRAILLFLLLSESSRADDVSSTAARYYEALIRQGRVSGAAFAALEHGEVKEPVFFGQATHLSLWRAASTSKVFTAIAIMRLVEQGQLDLDADINRSLKSFGIPAKRGRPITVRHLLSHTSGLDDPFVGSGFLGRAGPQPPLANVIRNWLPRRVNQPGEVYFYSNFGYGVLGALIEDVTGRRLEEYMQTEILEPLGMRDSTFSQPLPESMRDRVVPSLERTVLGFVRPADMIYHRSTSGGGLTTSFQDLIRFARCIQNRGFLDGVRLLQPETLDQMLGGETERAGDAETFGFGVGVNRGQRYWYSGGDLGGYHTVLLWFPEHGKALLTTAASTSDMATWGLVPKVMQQWFGPEAKRPAGPKVMPNPQARDFARHVAGIYRPVRYPHFDLGKTFVVTMDRVVRANPDGSLNYGGEPWIAIAPLRFQQQNGTRYLTFQEDTKGRIQFMDRSMERITWYESGRAAIICYLAFLILSLSALFFHRGDPNARPLHWMAWSVLLHSVLWLGAAVLYDPQRLILGLPWYLIGALTFGAVVPFVWAYLAVSTVRAIFAASSPLSLSVSSLFATATFALYVPFILYWRLTVLPLLGMNIW